MGAAAQRAESLAGRVAWITGGSSGIGYATARRLGALGARIAISGRRADALEEAAARLCATGIDACAVAADVGDARAVALAHERVASRLGAVSVLVCAAGTNVSNRSWSDLTPEGFSGVVAANLHGVMHCVHAVLPTMRVAREGVVVAVSSWAGWSFLGFAGAAYAASKTALGPLVASINDQEGRHGIRACHLCPGEVATPILRTRPVPPSETDMARMLRPEDVADAVAWVATSPSHVCVNEIVISPTWNRIYIGADDLRPR